MKIAFYGHSDDCIEIDINGKHRDEVGGYIKGDGNYSRALEVRTIGGAQGVRVHVIYDGCWSFAVGQLEDGRSLPHGWSFAIAQEHPCSTRLTVDTGDDLCEVTRKDGKPLEEGE